MWNGGGRNETMTESLESLGGGFNVTLEALSDQEKRRAIADKIRECAACMDRITELLHSNLSPGDR